MDWTGSTNVYGLCYPHCGSSEYMRRYDLW